MAYAPIAGIIPQYDEQDGWFLKFYKADETTPISMSIDATGDTLLAKAELDIDGFPTTDGNTLFIPFIDQTYTAFLFPTAAEADANDTINAKRVAKNIDPFGSLVRVVFASNFGVKSDGATDDLIALQKVIDDNAGFEIVLSGSVTLISDTLYLPRGTTLRGLGANDAWSGRVKGVTLKNTGVGTARIWTDIATVDRPFDATWFDLEDTPITVMIVTEGDSTLRDIAIEGQSGNVWDVGIFNPACKRVSHINVDTYGEFNLTGYYIDATWSDRNTSLINLHTINYRTVNPDQAPNEIHHENCFYSGGVCGVIGKGTNRDPELANDATDDLVWAWGGASDIVFNSCRMGNNATTPDILAHALYFDWGFARNVNDRNSRYFQNHYFYGCSFRAGNGRYSMLLDRTAFDNVLGVYGEMASGYVSPLETETATADAELIIAPNILASSTGRSYRIRLTGDEWDIRLTGWGIGATVTSSSGGSFRIRGIGYDGTGRFIICRRDDLTGTVLNGDTLTQAAGQTGKGVITAMDRTQKMNFIGQSSPQTASDEISVMSGGSGNFSTLNVAGMNISSDEWLGHIAGAINLFSDTGNFNMTAANKFGAVGDTMELDAIDGNLDMTSTSTVNITPIDNFNVPAGGSVDISGVGTLDLKCVGFTDIQGTTQLDLNTDASQMNFFCNVTDRLRWLGASLDPYNAADLGSSGRRWDTLFAINGTINTSDEREKTTLESIEENEKLCAQDLKAAIRKFKFKTAVEKKGEGARIHWGVGAQTVKSIFESHGLNPDEYAMFCYDEWSEEKEDGKITLEAGNRYGIRYEELLCFILSAL